MRALCIAIVSISISLLFVPPMASAAKMTLEQARIACRNETPQMPRGDKGNSRGFTGGASSAMQDCIKAKMSGK
jgi:hypothetical protein